MARKDATAKAKTNRTKGTERADFVGYVNITLTEADKDAFHRWMDDIGRATEIYLDAYDTGYQFTTKFDYSNDCFICSISNWSVEAEDSGVIYTARSTSPDGALWKAVFVWSEKLGRNLNNGAVKGALRDVF